MEWTFTGHYWAFFAVLSFIIYFLLLIVSFFPLTINYLCIGSFHMLNYFICYHYYYLMLWRFWLILLLMSCWFLQY